METPDTNTEKSRSRVYFYDYWRAFMVIMVLFHHSYLSYVIGYDWYVNDLAQTVYFTELSIILDVFMMPIMFFIAGYFAFPSIKKGVGRFIRKKVIRIVIPFFFGILILSPILMYMYLISHFPLWDINFFDFWLNEYFGPFFSIAHYWFLSLLFTFFVLFGVVYVVAKGRIKKIYESSESKPVKKTQFLVFLIAFLAIVIFLFYIAGFYYPDGTWNTIFNIYTMQITRSTLYALFFILGILIFIKRIELPKKFLKFTPILVVLSVLATFAFRFFKFDIIIQALISLGYLPLDLWFYNAIVHVLYCFLIFLTLMAVFQSYLNRQSKVLSRISANSYKIYLVHLIWVVIIQYLLLELPIDAFFKFLITGIGAFGLSWGTGELIGLMRRGFDKILKLN